MRTHWIRSCRNELVFFPSIISNIFQNEQQVVDLKFQHHQWLVEIHCYQTVLSHTTNCNHPKIQQWKTIPSIPFDEMLNRGESTWISLSIRFFVTQQWPTIPSFISGQFFELTATLEAAVLLGRRLVLPDNWDCSALESRGNLWKACWLKQGFFEDRNVRCLEFLPTSTMRLFWVFKVVHAYSCRRPKLVCLNGLAYWNEKRLPLMDRLRFSWWYREFSKHQQHHLRR